MGKRTEGKKEIEETKRSVEIISVGKMCPFRFWNRFASLRKSNESYTLAEMKYCKQRGWKAWSTFCN